MYVPFFTAEFRCFAGRFPRGRNEASSHGETKESRNTRPLDGGSFASYPREYFSRVDTASRVAVLFDRLSRIVAMNAHLREILGGMSQE